MSIAKRISTRVVSVLVLSALVGGTAFGQNSREEERERRDQQQTKQAQAVSKEIYDRIQKAQEEVDAKNYDGALRILNSLRAKDNLTDYERQNVLNYVGFVYYNMDNIDGAMQTYEEMLRIPTDGGSDSQADDLHAGSAEHDAGKLPARY